MQIDEIVQQLQLLLSSPETTVGFYVLGGLIVGYIVGRIHAPRSAERVGFQNRGEALVTEILRANFGSPDYHVMNHVTLRLPQGTTQIDHILVSRFGVFVIETKDYKGWIFGDPHQPRWTQVLFWVRFKFQNPLVQNAGHVRAVQDLLDFLPESAIKSVVIFTGEAKFKTPIPAGVFYASEVGAYLRNVTDEVMSRNRVEFCVGRLETARLAISGETDLQHVQYLRQKRARRPSRFAGSDSLYL